MKVLVIGKGGREHALADAAFRSGSVNEVIAAPGNPGIAAFGTCFDVSDEDIDGLVTLAKDQNVDLTIVGPESSLAAGIVDAFEKEGLKIFGPTQAAAQVESSKDFAKSIMKKYGIPTAAYATFDAYEPAAAYVKEQGAPIVIKENGLKAGKGVTVAATVQEALDALETAFAIPDNKVVIEECLEGFEFSLIALTHDGLVVPLEAAQDHKRVGDGDTGPNTGGMGSYSPVKAISPELVQESMETIMKPMAAALVKEGVPFTGFLYGGLMVTENGIQVIEFNARFGDPEAEVILPRLQSDFAQALLDVMNGQEPELKWNPQVAHGVVLASEGYPAGSTKGALISGTSQFDGQVFHMGTKQTEDGLVTDGGRVLMAVTMADTLPEAMKQTYRELNKISCDKLFYRTDIGKKDIV